MLNSIPLVSVIVPCFNHEKFIKEALLSILNQSYNNIQLIVIDDGSNDRSVEIIKEIQQHSGFIFESQQNIGLSKTLNKAISKYATGKYIAILASDDFWHPDKLKTQVEFLEQNYDFAAVCSNAYIVNDESETIRRFENDFSYPHILFQEIALGRKIIPALTVMVRKDIYDVVGLFDESLIIEDWDMWLRISHQHKIAGINDCLAYYRQHTSNISTTRLETMTHNRFKILAKWKGIISNSLYNKVHRNLEILAMTELGKNELLKNYIKPTLAKLLNTRYRKLVFKTLFN